MAICIRAVDYSETSQIVTLFTRTNGKIGAIAKGSKRPKSAFDGPLEVFSHGKIVFSNSSREKLAVLTELEQQAPLTHLSSDLHAMNCACFAAELVEKLTDEYDPHPQLFDKFLQFLQDANERKNPLAMLILFQLSLLREIGLQPVLNGCVNCKSASTGDWLEYYFSSSANGLICRDCESSFPDKIRLSKRAAKWLSNLKSAASVEEKTLKEIEKVLIVHFANTLGHQPKMAKHILKK